MRWGEYYFSIRTETVVIMKRVLIRAAAVPGNIFIKLSPRIVLIFNMSPDFFSLYLYSLLCQTFFLSSSTPISLRILPVSNFGIGVLS